MIYWDDEAKAKLVCHLERIIANHCSSKNYTMEHYRYPVLYEKDGTLYKSRGYVNLDDEYDISSMHYEFGSHRLDIGDALLEVLEFLEKYGSFEYYFDTNPDDYNDI